MCNKTTNYFSGCQHYRPIFELCIRATSAGLSKGCWDTTDLGVETLTGFCSRCTKSFLPSLEIPNHDPLSRTSSNASSFSSGSSMPGVEMLEGIRRARSNMSLSSMTSESSSVATPDHGVGDGLFDLEKEAFRVGEKEDRSSKKVVKPPNLHWRTYGGSAASVRFKRCG
ncbi:hypothetical protein LTR56_005642 [Elasticomyces elasticus]|nr:hypothetical protein LTR56_005642 [Elasticomyces elasticus]KAK3663971.1 hypothetical protein LTR22_005191 [Elasticomyces elasticus]KAK4927383.1 hypothetical protein LTR49_005788 [Elasticomyces elasticus]KAK5763348.1 hypothetical protein LTS12_006523 [Elasticomyces elasticus]